VPRIYTIGDVNVPAATLTEIDLSGRTPPLANINKAYCRLTNRAIAAGEDAVAEKDLTVVTDAPDADGEIRLKTSTKVDIYLAAKATGEPGLGVEDELVIEAVLEGELGPKA